MTTPPTHSLIARRIRRLIEGTVLFLFALMVFRAVGAEPYGVPTGSMAPTLLGNHRTVTCPRCGYRVDVGYQEGEGDRGKYYTQAFCPNCDCVNLGVENAPITQGDQLLVDKGLFDWCRPERWEIAVFRCPVDPNKAYVKRVVALPGESIEIRDGDIYIDHELARKTLHQLKAMRILVYDQQFAPPEGWALRWQCTPVPEPVTLKEQALVLDATPFTADYQWLVYHHWNLDLHKDILLTNEYSYNGGRGRSREPVHDFMLECDLEIVRGEGSVGLGITDGREELVAEMAVGPTKRGAQLYDERTARSSADQARIFRTSPQFSLRTGKTYHVEFAFVDRRVTLAIDGTQVFEPVDRPAVDGRGGIDRPVKMGGRGVELRLRNVRIFRDVHYTGMGHAVGTPVRLGAGQYFVLGDNSPNSEDNRIWSDAEHNPVPVRESAFLGKPFLVHLPSRTVDRTWLGREYQHQSIDWKRIRWLR